MNYLDVGGDVVARENTASHRVQLGRVTLLGHLAVQVGQLDVDLSRNGLVVEASFGGVVL